MALTVAQTDKPVIKVTGTTATADTVLESGQYVRVLWVLWHKPTTADDLLSLTDVAGNQILKGNAQTAKQDLWFPVDGLLFNGLAIDDLDSGEVYIGVAHGRKPL